MTRSHVFATGALLEPYECRSPALTVSLQGVSIAFRCHRQIISSCRCRSILIYICLHHSTCFAYRDIRHLIFLKMSPSPQESNCHYFSYAVFYLLLSLPVPKIQIFSSHVVLNVCYYCYYYVVVLIVITSIEVRRVIMFPSYVIVAVVKASCCHN